MTAVLSREQIAQELVATYSPLNWEDPWDAVEAYRAYQRYRAENTETGRTAAGRALEQPPSRIREWDNGSVPDPVRAVQVADRKGWLDIDWEDEQFQAINCLVAWIYSGGSIDVKNYVPRFTVEDTAMRLLARSLLSKATSAKIIENERSSARADELTLGEYQPIFGRYLTVLGCAVGSKAERETLLTLPDYLSDGPQHIRADFVSIYLLNRGVERPHKNAISYQIIEERPDRYTQELAALFETVIEGVSLGESGAMYIPSEPWAKLKDQSSSYLVSKIDKFQQ